MYSTSTDLSLGGGLGSRKIPRGVGPLLVDMVAYWRLEEGSGTRFDSFASHDLTDDNTVLSASGLVGTAADFEADNAESLSRLDSDLEIVDVDRTLLSWVNFESLTASQAFMGVWGVGTENFIVQKNTSGNFRFNLQTTDGFKVLEATTFGAPTTSTWYMVICEHDASGDLITIQVNNGTIDSLATGGAPVAIAGQEFTLGNLDVVDPTFGLDGLQDETGVWDRLLTAAEKTFLYNSGSGRSYAEVVAFSG